MDIEQLESCLGSALPEETFGFFVGKVPLEVGKEEGNRYVAGWRTKSGYITTWDVII